MKKKLFICCLVGFMGFFPALLSAQDEESESNFSFSGSVDTYFHTALGTEDDAPSTAFANNPGFSLGMVNLIGAYEGDKVGFTADLVFGPRGSDAVFASPQGFSPSSPIVNQLYAYWKPSESVTLTLGNFNTFLGYEVISPTVNFNYSTSYMFSYGPFSHTGLKANFDLGSGMNALVAVMNPTDFTEWNPVNTYTFGGQLGYSGDAGGAWLNLLYGDQNGSDDDTDVQKGTFQIDLTSGWNLGDSFYLGINGTYNTTAIDGADAATFMGFALYPQLTLSESTAIGLRGEYFATNFLGVVAGDTNGDESVIDVTISLNQKIGNLTIIPEFRIDMAGEETWQKSGDSASPEYTKMMPTFNLAAIYSF